MWEDVGDGIYNVYLLCVRFWFKGFVYSISCFERFLFDSLGNILWFMVV